jgi:hypothetical protein
MHAGASAGGIRCRRDAAGNDGRTNLDKRPNFHGLAYQHAASDLRAIKDTNTYSLADKYIDQHADTD